MSDPSTEPMAAEGNKAGEMWQVFILDASAGKTRTLDVEENCLIEQLYKQTQECFNDIENEQLRLVFAGKELEHGMDKRLSDFSIGNKSTLFLVVRLHGGINPMELIRTKKRELQPLPGYITVTTTEPDMITFDDDPNEKRAKMPCGHVIGPASMTQYCDSLLSKGHFHFFCPGFNGKTPCSATWEFFMVKHVAVISEEQLADFEKKLSENYLRKAGGIQSCPGCMTWVMREAGVKNCVRCPRCTKRLGRAYDFCWACLHDWRSGSAMGKCGNEQCDGVDPRIKFLANCPMTTIAYNDVKSPSVRACPKCGMLVQHAEACKHMLCKCGQEFCFICLKTREGGTWQCGSYSTVCEPAPRQTSLPGSQ